MSGQTGRIIFAGSPEFAVPALHAIADSRHELCAVLTQPDRPSGRGRTLRAGPVKSAASALGYEVLQPQTLRDQTIQAQLRELAPDLMVVVAYGQLLPEEVLTIPVRGCVNLHASLLPRWRGASPIQAAIRAGDTHTGVSLMQLDAGLDTGPVHASVGLPIGPRETAGELHDRLAEAGAGLLADYLDALVAGESTPRPQSDDGVTYAGRIDKADAVIDWSDSADAIDRQIRAYVPWPVAETGLDGARLRVWAAEPCACPGAGPAGPGQVLGVDDRGIVVGTGSGCLRLLDVQLPGRQRVRAVDFANGVAVTGKRLGS
ncbi:MAG TPA: methionyl-tRNA formyltransferase [Chromatiales bacterium]|nr:methionyl-tRNA formyltransferase [Chromatiales bacterium]